MEMKPVTHDAEWNPEIYGLNVVSPAIQANAGEHHVWVGSAEQVDGGFYPPSDCVSVVLPKDADASLAAEYEMPVRIQELQVSMLHSRRAAEGIPDEAPLYWR